MPISSFSNTKQYLPGHNITSVFSVWDMTGPPVKLQEKLDIKSLGNAPLSGTDYDHMCMDNKSWCSYLGLNYEEF